MILEACILENVSSTRPQAVPNLSEFLSSVEHGWRYFEECWKTNRWQQPIDFRSIFFHIMEVNGYLQLFVFQHSSFVLNRKKETHFHVQWNTPWRVPGWDLCCLCRLGKRTLISICQWWVWTALYTPWGWGDQKTPESGEDLPATTCFIMLFCCIGEFTVTPEVFGPLKCQTKWHLKKLVKA